MEKLWFEQWCNEGGKGGHLLPGVARAAQKVLAGHMRPAGRVFETPALVHTARTSGDCNQI